MLTRVEVTRGRPTIFDQYPEVSTALLLTLQQSGFAAHPKRRGPGRIRITLEQLKGQLYQQVPDLRRTHPQLSNSTVGHLMLPPNKHGNSAKHYKGNGHKNLVITCMLQEIMYSYPLLLLNFRCILWLLT